MIIIEGPDGAGKTTLKEEILKRYPTMIEGPRGTEDRSLLYTVTVPDTYHAMEMALHARSVVPVHVWDRLFFSEEVYSYITGRPNQFSPGQGEWITRLLEAMECPIILCLPPWEEVKENAKVHEQMTGVKENLREIYQDYAMMYHRMPNQTIIYDYTDTNPDAVSLDQVFRTIDDYLHERSKRQW